MNSNLGMINHELIHFLLSLAVGLVCFLRWQDKRLVVIAFFVGIMVDIDHWFDYFAHFGFVINFKNFFNVASYVHQSGKVYIPLHGWEFVFVFWLIGFFLERKFRIKGLGFTIFLSYLAHLLWDNFFFVHHPLAYSFIYRFINNFTFKSFNGF